MGDWALRDIGRAVTKVWLGSMNYSGIKDQYNYQEFALSGIHTMQGNQQVRLYPVEKWSSHFESFSSVWESVPQLNAYKLKFNEDPDAPQQTFIFGRLSKEAIEGNFTTDYYPEESAYVAPASETTTGTTGGLSVTTTGEQSFIPPISQDNVGITGISPVVASAMLTRDIPFVPSSVDHLASDATEYKNIIKSIGLHTHNIWDIPLQYKTNNIKYLKNSGPYWPGSNWSGATAEQSGDPGRYKIKVNANGSSLTLYRVAPMNCDIGYDNRYPWVFPYVDPETGEVRHGLFQNNRNKNGLFNNEIKSNNGVTNCKNIGFSMNFQVSAESSRKAFSSGGSTPSINIMWGWSKINDGFVVQNDPSGFIKSFIINFANNKVPELSYHDGQKAVKVILSNSPVLFTENTEFKITVEYLGTAMLVRTNIGNGNEEPKLISGQSIFTNGIKGVYTENPNISVNVSGCNALFDFMPVFYNPWSPQSDLGMSTKKYPTMEIMDENHKTDLNFDPKYPKTGFAKLIIASAFSSYADPSTTDAKTALSSLYDNVLDAFNDQTYSLYDMVEAMRSPYDKSSSKFKPESGTPQCILDSRNVEDAEGTSVLRPIARIFYYGSGLAVGSSKSYLPKLAQEPQSTLSIVWQVNTTYTTPLIFGFKTKNEPPIQFPENPLKDISEYVSKWQITWSSDQDYKILRSKSSVTLLNPPGYIIDLVSKNKMQIIISDSGYREYGSVVNDRIKPYIYRKGNIFKGITEKTSLSLGPGGDVYFTIESDDFIKLLEDYRLETSLRFDGLSYFTAFSELIQASDYSNIFKVEDFINYLDMVGGWKPGWRGGPTIFPANNRPITWDGMTSKSSLYYYSSMFFGYQPMNGKSYETQPGSILYEELKKILQNMNNPAALPLFFYRPYDGNFLFQVRDGKDDSYSNIYRPYIKSEITKEEELKDYLPLLSLGNQEAYRMTSNTANLASHFVVMGSDRATGLGIKATSVNPKWHALDNNNLNTIKDYTTDISSNKLLGMTEHEELASQVYGHVGYKKKTFQNAGDFVSDINSAYSYALSRMWWLMRPEISIENLTVYGVIDHFYDGLLNIDLTGLAYKKSLLQQSTITYDANEGTIISNFSVMVFPPWSH